METIGSVDWCMDLPSSPYFWRIMGLTTHRPLSSSSLGLPYRILYINPKKELLRGLWVRLEVTELEL